METLREKINKQREYFSTGETKDINFRIEKLKKLRDVLKSEEEKIFEALKKEILPFLSLVELLDRLLL